MEKELLQRYVEGNVSDDEITEVVAWLDADEANVREYMALHELYNITILNKALPQEASRAKKSTKLRTLGVELIKIAAVALIALGIGKLINTDPVAEEPVSWQTLHVPAGQRAEITLPDSSVVWVNAQSTLMFPSRFSKDKREVRLDGEAFFDVQSSPEHPFQVSTAKMNVVVTGTEFNVSSYSASELFAIALLKGKVSLQTVDNNEIAYRMSPDDYVEFSNQKLSVSKIEDPSYFSWREGLICFNREKVSDIIQKLELYYDVTIDVQRESLLKHRYTGKFRAKDGIEQVLKILQLEHNFTYVKDNETNCITIK